MISGYLMVFMELSYLFFTGHLEEGEKILMVAHRHFFIFFKASFKAFVFGLALPLMLFLFFPQLLIVFAVWGIIGVFLMFYHFIDWYFDAWIITDLAIIDVERNGLLDKQSKRVEYEMIDGIEYKITGFWPTVFNYGNISIDTMGSNMFLTLKDAASPKKLEKTIVGFQEKFVSDQSFTNYNSLKDMLAKMIAYHNKKDKEKQK